MTVFQHDYRDKIPALCTESRVSMSQRIQALTRDGTALEFLITPPDTCPVCHRSGLQTRITNGFMKNQDGFRIVYRCPVLECDNVYFATYLLELDPHMALAPRIEPGLAVPYEVSERIKKVAPQFEPIVSQAHEADSHGLVLIAGPGYRKALEFLVKEYLINFKFVGDSVQQENVRTALLGACIKLIDSKSVQGLAERCTWLGNDETHFQPRFPEYDLNDLKALLRLAVREIENELEAAEYLSIEPRSK